MKFPPVGIIYPPDVIPIIVVVPGKTPVKRESPMGFGVGVMVVLAMTILGTPAEGKKVVVGGLVVDPGEADIMGTDC